MPKSSQHSETRFRIEIKKSYKQNKKAKKLKNLFLLASQGFSSLPGIAPYPCGLAVATTGAFLLVDMVGMPSTPSAAYVAAAGVPLAH